jgi:hypothetical protein
MRSTLAGAVGAPTIKVALEYSPGIGVISKVEL